MLSLDDARWTTLAHAYGDCDDAIQWLRGLHDSGSDPSTHIRTFDFWGSLCHQGGVCTATYAAIPHIVAVIGNLPADNRWRLELLFRLQSESTRGAVTTNMGFTQGRFAITFALWQRSLALVQSLVTQSHPLRSWR